MPVALSQQLEFDLSTVYQPTSRQKLFHSCPADIALYGGAVGGGKSEALLWEGFIQMLEAPGNRGLLLRRTFSELERSLIQRSLAKFPRSVCEYAASKKSWIFRNGSVLEFGYCEREKDVYQYQSAEYGFIGIDELTHFTKTEWEFLLTRLRSTVPGVWPRVRAASNPGNVGHAWVKALFIEGKRPDTVWEDEHGIKYAFIPARLWDNPFLLKNDPLYLKRLEMLDPKLRQALLEGDWDAFAGQFFDSWNPEIHVLKEHFDPPKSWPRFRALDWGTARPYSVGWYAVTPQGQLYRYRELYGWGGEPDVGSRETASEVALKIREIEDDAEEYDLVGPADTQIWSAGKDTGISVAETFQNYGIAFVRADKNRLNGWDQCRYRLGVDPETGRPRFFVSPRCHHFIRTIPTLVHSENKPEDLDSRGEDHCADEFRYACMYWRGEDNEAVTPVPYELEEYYSKLSTPQGVIYLPRETYTPQNWWEY